MMQDPTPSDIPIPEEEEYYSSWSLFLVCVLLMISLWTSYYLQIRRIRAIHETLVNGRPNGMPAFTVGSDASISLEPLTYKKLSRWAHLTF